MKHPEGEWSQEAPGCLPSDDGSSALRLESTFNFSKLIQKLNNFILAVIALVRMGVTFLLISQALYILHEFKPPGKNPVTGHPKIIFSCPPPQLNTV